MPSSRLSQVLDEQPHKKVKFDPTINLGHVLTFVGFIATGAIGYFDLRERISITELRAGYIQHELQEEKDRIKDSLSQIKSGIVDMSRKVDDLRERQLTENRKRTP